MSSKIFYRIRLLKLRNKEELIRVGSRSCHSLRLAKLSSDTTQLNSVPNKYVQSRLSSRPMGTLAINKLSPHQEKEQSFYKLLNKDNHSFDEIDKLYELSTVLNLPPYIMLKLFKVLAENEKVTESRMVLEKVPVTGHERSNELLALAHFAGQIGSLKTVVKVMSSVVDIDDIFSVRKSLPILSVAVRSFLDVGNIVAATESFVLCVPMMYRDSRIMGNYMAYNVRALVVDILQTGLKAGEYPPFMSLIDKHMVDDQHKKNMILGIIVAGERHRGGGLLMETLNQIPEHLLSERMVSYAINHFFYLRKFGMVKYLMNKYSNLVGPGTMATMDFFLFTNRSNVDEIYAKCMEQYRESENIPEHVIRMAISKSVRSNRLDLLQNLGKIYEAKYQNLFLFHSFMKIYLAKRDSEGFFGVFRKMFSEGQTANGYTYYLVLKQFASKRDLESCFALIDYMIDKRIIVSMRHMTVVLEACNRKVDVEAALKIEELVNKLRLRRSGPYYANLMSVYTGANIYDKALEIFSNYQGKPPVDMFSELIKIHVRQGNYERAKEIYEDLITRNVPLNAKFYGVLVDYFCKIGEFDNAEALLATVAQIKKGDDLNARESFSGLEPFEVMMKNYNDKRRYTEAISVYNSIIENDMIPTANIYSLLMKSLVQLSFVNKTNYSRPASIAEELLATHERGSSSRPFLAFRVIKPLIKFLSKYYSAVDALALLERYRKPLSAEVTSRNISILKQELVIYGESKQWDRFNAVFQNFVEEIKSRMVRGKRPLLSRDVFLPVIGYKAVSGALIDQQKEIQDLVQDFIFVHGFNISNKNLNEIAIILLSDTRTFDFALEIIEHKLMGGFIAHAVIKGREWRDSILPLGASPLVYPNPIRPPRIYLRNESYMKVAVHLNNFLRVKVKAEPEKMDEYMLDFKIRFPKIFKNFPATISNFTYVPGYEEKQNYRDSFDSGEEDFVYDEDFDDHF